MRHVSEDPRLQYIQALFAPEDPLLSEIRRHAEALGLSGMMVAPEEGALLQLLVALHRPRVIVEVGCFLGYSTLWMARALGEGGIVHTIEREPQHAALARQFIERSEVSDKMRLHEGAAQKELGEIAKLHPQVDMVFIDADKGNYGVYLAWAEKHLAPGGVIVGDNTFLFGTVYQAEAPEGRWEKAWSVMRDFNERLADRSRYWSVLMNTPEGLTVAVKR